MTDPTTNPTTDPKQPLTGQQVADAGLEGWRKVLQGLTVRYVTGDFTTGAALVQRIAEAADAADHHPDVDLRYPHLTVSLLSHDVGALTVRDLDLAREITRLATEAGVQPTEHAPDVLELAIDTPSYEQIRPFWAAVLGYDESGDQVSDPAARLPNLWFQETGSTAPDRQRFHLDVSVPHDALQQRLDAVVAAGGTLVDDSAAPAFWVLEDADGNRACLCTWQSRD